jgi:outer membrane biosynthesis protein TonB
MRSAKYILVTCFLLSGAVCALASQVPFLVAIGDPPPTNQQATTSGNIHTFMGKILNQNDVRFILRDDETDAWYHLDDQAKAQQFFGKDVVVTGTYDGLSGTIRLQTIRERTASDQPVVPIAPSSTQDNGENEPAGNSAVPVGNQNVAACTPPQVNPPQPSVAAVPRHDATNSAFLDKSSVAGSAAPAPAAPVPAAAAPAAPAPAASAKDNSGFLLNLPEEAVAVSSSVAVVSRRSVLLPSEFRSRRWQDENDLVVGKPLSRAVPSYPFEARQQGIEGTVKLHAVIGIDGSIKNIEPVSGPPSLINASVSAIRGWRFAPTRLDGRPIEAREDITLFFRL